MNAPVRIQGFNDDYDPFHAMLTIGLEERVADPYPEVARLRALAPAHALDLRQHFDVAADPNLAGLEVVTVLSQELVNKVLTDAENFSNEVYVSFLGKSFGRSVTTMDPPEHTRYRRLFQKAFLPNMIEHYRETVVPQICNALVDSFIERGKAELVGDFARHFAFTFIMDLLELPMEDRVIFQKLAVGQLAVSFDPPRGEEAIAKLTSYIEHMVAERRENPVSERDFVHTIATAEIDGERLPHDVVIGFFRQLMNAGGDTSYHGFSNILCGLLTNPEQLEAVRNDRNLVSKAIDEGLRWNCPVFFLFRSPAKETEVGGIRLIPGKHYVQIGIGAANRDPAFWGDDADRFDLFRPAQRHNAFGSGIHVCIGQHLAKLEMQVALNTLLDRLPDLRLDPSHPAPSVRGLLARSSSPLHVLFGQAS